MSPDPAIAEGLANVIPEMLDELEEYITGGNRAAALIKATEVVEQDPECVEALWALLELGLPERRRDGSYRIDPTLAEAAKGWTLAKKIVALDPTHRGAWFRGAILATQHLGLSEEVLQWWEDFRAEFPTDTTPVIEQAALLIRMGFYAEASERLEVVVAQGMDEMPREQLFRVERMNQTIRRYYEMEKIDVFKPQNPDHSTWKDIDGMRNLKPGSEKFTFFMLAGPLVIWEALALQMFMPKSTWGMCAAFLLVYASILWVRRISITITDKRNRPVLDLWRAIEVEATSGKVCIPEKIRDSKLYRVVINKDYPVAFRQRLEKIDVFKPQNPDHSTWKDIDGMRNLKPGSEKFTFFMLAGPLVIWEALALQMFMPKSTWGMCAAFLLVYASILWVRRISITITDKRNRPVLDLWRAIEVEATSGKVCIPEKIRDSKLYRIVINKDYPVAFRQRMEKIVENDEKMSKRWEMKMPYWTAFDLPTADEEE